MTVIEQSNATRNVGLKLGILAAGLFVVGTNAFVIAGVLPAIAASLHTTTAAVGYSITWYSIVVAVGSPAVSTLLARMPRATLMALGLALIAVGTFLAAAAAGIGLFTAGRIVAAIGGAALVPTATAAAPTLVAPERRGRALAATGLGFSLASAVGAPFGTFLADLGGWRLALSVIGALAAVIAVAVAVETRGLPLGRAVPFAARFSVLAHPGILLALLTTLLMVVAFNVVYIFSSDIVAPATGGNESALAALLLVYGAFGIVGNWLGGRLTDGIGGRLTALVALALEAVAFVALIALRGGFAATAVLFALWGVGAYAAIVPVQSRLAAIDPERAGISLSWYSTGMYVGIALAPVLGAATLSAGVPVTLLAAAAAALLGLIAFEAAHRR
ncbi:MFS transporter [Gryllotalpicola kribbensis]|uniref:MFS transporter n=1 Tax=Gryllotalpicola kribbensis TaxID=993084 RepID=UPI0031D88D97